MLLRIVSIVLVVISCSRKDMSPDVGTMTDLMLDHHFLVSSHICEFTTSELSIGPSSILDNPCIRQGSQRTEVILSDLGHQFLSIRLGEFAVGGSKLDKLRIYLEVQHPEHANPGRHYLYRSRGMFSNYSVSAVGDHTHSSISGECHVQISDAYYSEATGKAVIAMKSCMSRDVMSTYYFRRIQGMWVINFVEVGD